MPSNQKQYLIFIYTHTNDHNIHIQYTFLNLETIENNHLDFDGIRAL